MEIDFSLPPPAYVRFITEDGKILYYLRDKLINSCRFFSSLAEYCVKEELTEIKVSIPSSSLNLFFNFMEKKKIAYHLSENIRIVEIADMFDLHYMDDNLSTKEKSVNRFLTDMRDRYCLGVSYTHIIQFLRYNRYPINDWGLCIYFLKNIEDIKRFQKKSLENLPEEWPSHGEQVEYQGELYYSYRISKYYSYYDDDIALFKEKEDYKEGKLYTYVNKNALARPLNKIN